MGREARVTRGSGAHPGRGPRVARIPRASSMPHTTLGTWDRAVSEREPVSPCSQELSLQRDGMGWAVLSDRTGAGATGHSRPASPPAGDVCI